MSARMVLAVLALSIGSPASADELSDKVCPILEKAAAEIPARDKVSIQADLVLGIGGAYDFDGPALRNVTDNIDASAGVSCAAARDKILKHLEMQSLEEALR